MGSVEYPNIQINNVLVEVEEEEPESLDNEIEETKNTNKTVHILLKSHLSDEDTQDLTQGMQSDCHISIILSLYLNSSHIFKTSILNQFLLPFRLSALD